MIRRYSRGLFQQDRPKADMSGALLLRCRVLTCYVWVSAMKRRDFMALLGGAAARRPRGRWRRGRRNGGLWWLAPSRYLVDSGFTDTSWINQFPLSRICALY